MLQELRKLKLIWTLRKCTKQVTWEVAHLTSPNFWPLAVLCFAAAILSCGCWFLGGNWSVSWEIRQKGSLKMWSLLTSIDWREGKIVFFDPLLCGRSPRFYAGQKEMNNFSLGSFCWHSLLACKMRSWYPKQPYFYGCFNWIVPNLYLGNGCFSISIH